MAVRTKATAVRTKAMVVRTKAMAVRIKAMAAMLANLLAAWANAALCMTTKVLLSTPQIHSNPNFFFCDAGENEGDLTFNEGDIINLLDQSNPDGWWEGEVNGRQGFFPSNFVQAI